MFASVIVDIKNKEVNRYFDYLIPSEYEQTLKKGMRVVVPFNAQLRLGFVTGIFKYSDKATKSIAEVLDVIPSINDETFMMIDHIYHQTHQLYAKIFETVVPTFTFLKYQKLIKLVSPSLVDEVFLQLFNSKNEFKVSKNDESHNYKIRKYLSLNAIELTQIYEQKTKHKFVTTYQYQHDQSYKNIHKFDHLIDQLANKSYTKDELLTLGFSESNILTLSKNNVFKKQKEIVQRELSHIFQLKDKKVILTEDQEKIYQLIKEKYHSEHKFLLHGITGSGKTEIYLNLIEDIIKLEKQVLILVPEITLIAPMAKRLKSRFDDVAIYHSGLSAGEKHDEYQKIKTGSANIVLGTRSASFLPLEKLGIIIVDESHDSSYIQDEQVIYDAIDILEQRAKYHQIPIVLGTATPKISRYYQALNHNYQLLELNKRPLNQKLPSIHFVDMKDELQKGNTSIISSKLDELILDRISKKEQIMILFNRKGYAPFVMCRTCGDVPVCPTCGISLTYYNKEKELKCHYCGHHEPYVQSCKKCESTKVKEVGVGIEYVESMIKKKYPQAKILRMDANMTKTKGSHEIIWHQFNELKADILLGTQMIAKGLDFPKVTLVGVLMADLLLRIPSYHASEQAYTLLTQISGRSGRAMDGKVIIQGYDLSHYAIDLITNDYQVFYQKAISDRKLGNYEPFNHISQILFEGDGYLQTYQIAFKVKKELEKLNNDYKVLGPIAAYIKKQHDKYRFIITLKYKTFDQKIFEIIDSYQQKDLFIKYYPNQDIL